MLPLLLLFTLRLVASEPLFLDVDCATSSLHAARDTLRATYAAADAARSPRPPATVRVRGPCHLAAPLSFDARD